MMSLPYDLRQFALRVFHEKQAADKVRLLNHWRDHPEAFSLDTAAVLTPASDQPGRPDRPELVDPVNVPKRSPHTLAGRAALMHAICHIEFNAIALALDAVWRFAHMPEDYYRQWMNVAVEEAMHFGLVQDQLQRMGCTYGEHAAHDGLWAMCEQTQDDITARMALVPRTLEARGLDATPIIQTKLRTLNAPDAQACVAILDVILRDEIGHVAIGNHWYHWLCEKQQLDPVEHFRFLHQLHGAPAPKPPLNWAARRQAGFSDDELTYFSQAAEPRTKPHPVTNTERL